MYYRDFMQVKDLSPSMQLKLRKKTIATNTHRIIPPFNNWSIWWFTQTCQCVFTRLCQCHLELVRAKKLSFFYLGHFSSSKSFNHIRKDADILHLKLGGSCRLSYFSTFNPLRHTSHHHSQFIVGRWFLA